MSFAEAVKSVFSQYVNFQGRSRRSEYWYFCLFSFIVSTILSVLGQVTGNNIFNTIAGIFGIAILLPSLGVAVRRLHDIGKSGWFVLINLIPVIGSIILIIWYVKDSEPGDNKYGPNPKGMGRAAY